MSNGSKGQGADDRRKAKRTAIQEAFSLFLVIPDRMGMSRTYLRDMSSTGLAFFTDSGESFSPGDSLEVRLYIGPAFFLPLPVNVVRASGSEVAVSFSKPDTKVTQAIAKFLEFIELASEAAR